MSKWTLKEQGEANQYCLIDEDGQWVFGLIANGELHVHNQQVLMRRIVACLNACAPLSIESLESHGLGGITSSVEHSLERRLKIMTEWRWFLDHKVKCLEMERQAQQAILQQQRRVLDRTQAFLHRVRHWEEGKPDLHDTKEDIRAELDRMI